MTWISHGFTCIPHPDFPLPPPSLPDPSGSSQCTRFYVKVKTNMANFPRSSLPGLKHAKCPSLLNLPLRLQRSLQRAVGDVSQEPRQWTVSICPGFPADKGVNPSPRYPLARCPFSWLLAPGIKAREKAAKFDLGDWNGADPHLQSFPKPLL